MSWECPQCRSVMSETEKENHLRDHEKWTMMVRAEYERTLKYLQVEIEVMLRYTDSLKGKKVYAVNIKAECPEYVTRDLDKIGSRVRDLRALFGGRLV